MFLFQTVLLAFNGSGVPNKNLVVSAVLNLTSTVTEVVNLAIQFINHNNGVIVGSSVFFVVHMSLHKESIWSC
jgi:hypothetical protein